MRTASRARAALLVVLGALGLVALGGATWFTASVPGTLDGTVELAASGSEAAPALTGIAVVLLAAGAALGIVGPVGRRVVGAVVLLGALGCVGAVVPAVRAPGERMREAAAEATGVAQVPADVAVGAAPWVAVVLASLVALLGLWHLAGRGTWPRPTARHERDARDGDVTDPARDWDALSEGHDPS